MWSSTTRAACVALAASVFCAAAPQPGGRGAEILQAKCVSCHQVDLIRQQRLTKGGWQREVDKMIRWGATMTDGDRDLLVEYLASSRDAESHGGDVLRQRCLGCHQADLIDQQRLGTAAWTREIDKMIRWGASLSPAEKDALVAYLSKR